MKTKIALMTLLLASPLANAQTMDSFTDSRDGQTYTTVRFEDPQAGTGMTIMAENLNYKTADSYAYPDDENHGEDLREDLGLLYTWEAAKKACPDGWQLPSDNEWTLLLAMIGGEDLAGNAMKSTDTWKNEGNGTNSSGFNALPAGGHNFSGFVSLGDYSYFWSSTEEDGYFAWYRYLSADREDVIRSSTYKSDAYSIRCLRD